MSTKPLVSILAPCYNGERYLKKFLGSVLSQDYDKLELILINDGSTDSSETIVQSYEDELLKNGVSLIIHNQENQGIGAAINNGLKLMHGDYFTWIGIDDYYHPQFFTKLVSFMEENKRYCVVRNDGYVVDENNNDIILGRMADSNHDKYNEHLFENAILERNFQFGYSLVRTADFLKVNPTRSIYPSREGQNWQLLLPLFYNGLSAFYEEPLYYVLNNAWSVSRNPRKYGFKHLIAQKEEYKTILTNTLHSFDLKNRDKYLHMVNVKYARMKMQIAYMYKEKEYVQEMYAELKSLNSDTFKDKFLYLRSLFPFLDGIYKFIRK